MKLLASKAKRRFRGPSQIRSLHAIILTIDEDGHVSIFTLFASFNAKSFFVK